MAEIVVKKDVNNNFPILKKKKCLKKLKKEINLFNELYYQVYIFFAVV